MTDKEPRHCDNDALEERTSPLKPDLQSAKDFLVHITRRWPEVCEGAQLEVTGILKVDENKKQIRPALFPPTEDGITASLNYATALNNQGFHIYFGANPRASDLILTPGRRPTDADVAGAVNVFADGDDDAASNALLNDTLSSIVVRTGSVPGPRVQTYWELAEPMRFRGFENGDCTVDGGSEWRAIQKGLIAHFHSDPSISNPSRILRLPGFISHAKDATRVNELVTWKATGVGPVDWSRLPIASKPGISERAVKEVPQPTSDFDDLFHNRPRQARTEADLLAMLEATRIQGQWHNNMLSVTASLVGKGWSDEAITQMCGPYCNDGPTDPDLIAMIEGARKKGWTPDRQDPTHSIPTSAPHRVFKLVRASELAYREPEFIIKGLIETESLAQIFGESGGGKSFLALDIAACIASGTPFHEHAVKQGAVIYIAGEGHNGLKRRLTAWEKLNHVSLDHAPLFLSKVAAQFLDAVSAQAVADAVDPVVLTEGPPALIIVDTLARNFGPGDENATKDMSNFVAAMDCLKGRHRCTLILVHHTGHTDKDRGRGSAALKAALDAEFRVEKTDDIIRLVNTKMKDAAPPPEMYFRLETVALDQGIDGAEVTSAALVKEEREQQVKKKRLSDNERLAISAFRCAAPFSGRLDDEGNFAGLHLEDWRPVFYQMSTADNIDSKKKAFQRARKDLEKKGEISVKNDVYTLSGETAWLDLADFERALKTVTEAKRKEQQADPSEGGRDTGQGGTDAGQVPVPCREEPGQAGQGSIDLSLVPPSVDVLIE